MSLFAGIFKAVPSGASQVSSLFADNSRFRRPPPHAQPVSVAVTAPAVSSEPQQATKPGKKDKKRKLEQLTGVAGPSTGAHAGTAPVEAAGTSQTAQKKKKQKKDAIPVDAPAAPAVGSRQDAAGQSGAAPAMDKTAQRSKAGAAPMLAAEAAGRAQAAQPSNTLHESLHTKHPSTTAAAAGAAEPATGSSSRHKRMKLAQERKKLKAGALAQPSPAATTAPAAPAAGSKAAAATATEQDDLRVAGQPAETAAPGSTEDKRDLVEDPEKLQRTVFVGNLPLATKRKALTKLFSQYGTVQSVRLRSVPVKPDLKMPRKAAILSGNLSETRGIANAYIVFESTEAADAALAQNMQELGGLHVRVDRAAKKSIGGSTAGVEYDRSRSVFVGNLPFDIEDEELIRLFNDRSDELGMEDAVSAVRVVRDSQSHLGKGFAFVLLKTRAAARAALSLDGQEVRKRAIRVTRVQAAAKAAKKPASAVRTGSSSGQRQPGAPAARGHKRPMPDSDEWRGIRTKGRAKVVVGQAGKPAAQRGPGGPGSKPAEGLKPLEKKRKAPGKRPSVAARKTAAKGSPGHGKLRVEKKKIKR